MKESSSQVPLDPVFVFGQVSQKWATLFIFSPGNASHVVWTRRLLPFFLDPSNFQKKDGGNCKWLVEVGVTPICNGSFGQEMVWIGNDP